MRNPKVLVLLPQANGEMSFAASDDRNSFVGARLRNEGLEAVFPIRKQDQPQTDFAHSLFLSVVRCDLALVDIRALSGTQAVDSVICSLLGVLIGQDRPVVGFTWPGWGAENTAEYRSQVIKNLMEQPAMAIFKEIISTTSLELDDAAKLLRMEWADVLSGRGNRLRDWAAANTG